MNIKHISDKQYDVLLNFYLEISLNSVNADDYAHCAEQLNRAEISWHLQDIVTEYANQDRTEYLHQLIGNHGFVVDNTL